MLDKLLESGVSKLCELKLGNETGYIKVGWDRAFRGRTCKVCGNSILVGELVIWDSEWYQRSYYHPECFFAVFIEKMLKLEDELESERAISTKS